MIQEIENIKIAKLQVRVEKIYHRDQNCLAIFFQINGTLSALVRKIENVRWSQTNKCWYVKRRFGLVNEILATFKDVAWVDIKALKNNSEQKAVLIESNEIALDKNNHPKIKKHVAAEALNEEQLQLQRMMEQKLNLRGYSKNTCKTYLQQFKEFQRFYYDSKIIELTEIEIRNYILYLVEHRKVSKSLQNQAINAIKFFYEKMMLQDRKVYYFIVVTLVIQGTYDLVTYFNAYNPDIAYAGHCTGFFTGIFLGLTCGLMKKQVWKRVLGLLGLVAFLVLTISLIVHFVDTWPPSSLAYNPTFHDYDRNSCCGELYSVTNSTFTLEQARENFGCRNDKIFEWHKQ